MSIESRYQHFAEIGVILLISLSSITTLFEIRGSHFIQPQEIVFMLFLPVHLVVLSKVRRLTRLDRVLLFYLFVFALNCFWHPDITTLVESLGMVYLLMVYFIVSRVLTQSEDPRALLKKSIVALLIANIAIGLLGYSLHLLGMSDRLVYFYEDFPYLGDIWRLNGWSWSNLFMSTTCLCLFFIPQMQMHKKWKILLLVLGFVVALLTVSKELAVFIFLFTFLLLIQDREKKPFKLLLTSSIFVAAAMIMLTFFVLRPASLSSADHERANSSQVSPHSIGHAGPIKFYPTTYFHLFQRAIELIREYPITGVGSGRFREQLRRPGSSYPDNFGTYDTHDLYWGQTAELGLLYVVFLLLLLREIGATTLARVRLIPEDLRLVFLIVFLFFLICFLVGGSKHYRHFWIFLGIVNAFILRGQQAEKEVQ